MTSRCFIKITGIIHNAPKNSQIYNLLEEFKPDIIAMEMSLHSYLVRTTLKNRIIQECPDIKEFIDLPTEYLACNKYSNKHGIPLEFMDSDLMSIVLLGELAQSCIKKEKLVYQKVTDQLASIIGMIKSNALEGDGYRINLMGQRIKALFSTGKHRVFIVAGLNHVEDLFKPLKELCKDTEVYKIPY